jgi:hypothetical protein
MYIQLDGRSYGFDGDNATNPLLFFAGFFSCFFFFDIMGM